jgi:hypothetical protein
MATSLFGFGEVSIAPKRYPFALARSIEDGPGRWYLEKHCKTESYVVCRYYPNGFPDRLSTFLWGAQGLIKRATPSDLEKIRAEELMIVSRAAALYPSQQLERSASNFIVQLLWIGIDPTYFMDHRMDPRGRLARAVSPAAIPLSVWVQRIVAAISLAIIAINLRQAQHRTQVAVITAVLAIVVNAAICGLISAPDARYQNRVAWVLPVLACTLLSARKHPIIQTAASNHSV